MNAKVVQIQNEFGGTNDYVLASARYREFVKDYPFPDYRVEISSQSAIKGPLEKVINNAILNGTDLSSLGFSTYLINSFKITARLLNSQGEVIIKASAMQRILSPKDYETGETAAIQRLLVAAGRDGRLMDMDEEAQIKLMGNSIKSNSGETKSEDGNVVAVAGAEATEETVNTDVTPQLSRQVERLLAKLEKGGIKAPKHTAPTTNDEAIALVKALQTALKA